MDGAEGAPARAPAGFSPSPDFAASTSRWMMRPCGPEPADAQQVDAGFLGEPLGQRRSEHAIARRRRLWSSLRFWRGGLNRGRLRCLGLGRRGLRLRSRGSRLRLWRRCTWTRAGGGRFHILAFAGQDRDHLVDRHVGGAFRHHDLGDGALVDRLDLHGRLVGLDLGDDVAGFDLVAFLLKPLGKVALLHRGRQRRHENVDRHGVSASSVSPRSGLVSWCGSMKPSPAARPSRLRRPQ